MLVVLELHLVSFITQMDMYFGKVLVSFTSGMERYISKVVQNG